MLQADSLSPAELISRQLESLAVQQRQIEKLRVRLLRLNQTVCKGAVLLGVDWIDRLEMLVLQEEVLSESEIAALLAVEERLDDLERDWEVLVADVQSAMAAQMPDHCAHAQALAWRWMRLVHLTVAEDTGLAFKLTALQRNSRRAQQLNGIHDAMLDWVMTAFTHARVALLGNYLTPTEQRPDPAPTRASLAVAALDRAGPRASAQRPRSRIPWHAGTGSTVVGVVSGLPLR